MPGTLKSSFIVACACAALFVTAAIAGSPRPRGLHRPDPTTLSGTCKTPHTEFISTDQVVDGNPTEWLTMPNGTINFKSRRLGCVIVTLSGVAYTEAEYVFVQMLLDDTAPCGPAYGVEPASTFLFPNMMYWPVSMTYVCKDVPPGDHSIQAQYVTQTGNLIDFFSHTLTVAHN